MPVLGDYVASLISSITEARASTDMQSVNLSKVYLQDELLRNFAIPRMRIGEVSMDVPVAIDFTEGKTAINFRVEPEAATERVFSAVCFGYNLTVSEVEDNKDAAKDIRSSIYGNVQSLMKSVDKNQNLDSLRNYSNQIAEETKTILIRYRFDVERIQPSQVTPSIERTLRNQFLLTSIDRVGVFVEAAQLKQQAPQTLLNLKIKIVEDGVQWAISEDEKEGVRTQLIPE